MFYLRICFDRPGVEELRNEVRATHRAYLKPYTERGLPVFIYQAGPMCVGDSVDTNLGSFLIVEANSLEEAQAFHDGDPFTKAGVYGDVKVVRWDRHIDNS